MFKGPFTLCDSLFVITKITVGVVQRDRALTLITYCLVCSNSCPKSCSSDHCFSNQNIKLRQERRVTSSYSESNESIALSLQGHIWKKLLEWYGLDDNHELDRRYIGDQEEDANYEGKSFQFCVLSPMVATMEKQTKMLDLKEYVGYIECQIRRILKVPNYR